MARTPSASPPSTASIETRRSSPSTSRTITILRAVGWARVRIHHRTEAVLRHLRFHQPRAVKRPLPSNRRKKSMLQVAAMSVSMPSLSLPLQRLVGTSLATRTRSTRTLTRLHRICAGNKASIYSWSATDMGSMDTRSAGILSKSYQKSSSKDYRLTKTSWTTR